jgi:hypothetical protein
MFRSASLPRRIASLCKRKWLSDACPGSRPRIKVSGNGSDETDELPLLARKAGMLGQPACAPPGNPADQSLSKISSGMSFG